MAGFNVLRVRVVLSKLGVECLGELFGVVGVVLVGADFDV